MERATDCGRAAARLALVAAALAVVAAVGGCGGGDEPPRHVPKQVSQPPVADLGRLRPPSALRPNIVFVLTDDLATNLVRFMPHVKQMRREGATFSNYFVTDSLCCPSRASIFSGRLPHNTKIFTNTPPMGGFQAFHARGEENATFATSLHRAGYRTAMMGKYLNGYRPGRPLHTGRPYVPPGWDDWRVSGFGYPEFHYRMNENGVLTFHGHAERAYLTDVISRRGDAFIRDSANAGKPFFLELATFAPHAPYTPAPRDSTKFPGLRAPRSPSFDVANRNAPRWLASARGHPLALGALRRIDHAFRRRAQSMQAVDLMLASVQRALKDAGVERNTYVIFSSDNGYHMGEHRLLPGKLTAFETDIHVPLVVTGPGIGAGRTVTKLAANVDLAPTFAQIGRTRAPGDGRSLLPLLHGHRVKHWRDAVLIEHRGPVNQIADPDLPGPGAGNPISYEAIRTQHETYVAYANGQREYYDLRRDPFEIDNTFADLSVRHQRQLEDTTVALFRCRGRRDCDRAAQLAKPRGGGRRGRQR